MDKITNWSHIIRKASAKAHVVVVMVDQEDCTYCRRVEDEFFSAVLASGRYHRNSTTIGKISIDAGETIIDQHGKEISTRDFLAEYQTDWTPTVLFLDHQKREVADRLTGLLTPDYYVYYLERSIDKAIRNLQNQS